MKRILALILAMTMIFCLCLTSCTKTNAGGKDNKDKNADPEFVEYYNNLEKVLEEFKSKSELDNEILATVGGLPISAAAVRYTYMVVDAPADETTTAEEIKEQIELFYRENAALIDYAYKNGVTLTEQDITKIKADITGMQLQLGDEYEKAFAESPFTEFFYYFQVSLMQALYSRIYEDAIANHDSDMAKKALEETLKFFEENEYVRAKHILIQFPAGEGEDGELTDAQKAETLAKANEVLDKVNAMADISEFDALIEEYNDDPGMQSNPGGYYFGKGQMVAPFEESAYSLEEGKTSGLVETSFGYHILLKLPLNDEAIYNSEKYTELFGTELYNAIIANLDSFTVEYEDNHDERIADFKAEYEKLSAKTETAE